MTVVAVTGGSGFIGSRVVRWLRDEGHTAFSVGRSPSDDFAVDLLRPDALTQLLHDAQPDAVVFCAWTTRHGEYWTDPDNAQWVRAVSSQIDESTAAGVSRVITIGSSAEPDAGDGWTTPTPYGLAKEAVGRHAASRAGERGGAVHARLFSPFGPGEDPRRLVPSAIRAFLRGERFATGPTHRRRDVMHVDDVAVRIGRLAVGTTGGTIDIGTGIGTAIGDLIAHIAHACGVDGLASPGELAPRDEPEALIARVGLDAPEFRDLALPDLAERLQQTVAYWRQQ